MNIKFDSAKRQKFISLIPYILSILAIIAYVILAVRFAHITLPVMDEGTYLIKGKWFLDGTYHPFQEYGPVTNKPPLSFFTLGLSQVFFSPGLRSGRYFVIFLSLVLLLGQWLTVRRLAGPYWAAASVSLFAISPAWIIYYSRATTQVITALCIAWCLFFILGDDRKCWQLCVGAALASLSAMVRQNMLPFFALAMLYLLWQNGLKKGILCVAVGSAVFITCNALYWPEMYATIWQPLMPGFINELVNSVSNGSIASGDLGLPFLNKEYQWIYEAQVFFDGVRFFFVPFIFSVTTFLTIPLKDFLLNKKNRKSAFLALTFTVLTALHFLAALNENNFMYSFPAYFSFYLPVGITLIPIAASTILKQRGTLKTLALALFTLIVSTGIGLSLYRDISAAIMELRVPSISERTLFHGKYELWDVLLNRFGIDIPTQEFLLPAAAGLLAGVLLLILSALAWAILRKHRPKFSYLAILWASIMFIGVVLSPTPIMAGKGSIQTCPDSDVIARLESVAARLETQIAPGSLVYWEGIIPLPLLYIPDVRLFPAQLNMEFYFRVGGDADFLERKGYWNQALAERWIDQADYLLLSEKVVQQRSDHLNIQYHAKFEQLASTASINPCDDTALITIFKRLPQ
ncbi:MAG TPA: glycosyltransferase family 39 protein [Anaerolineae bacterium]|nr:glycosyltransferase family 39 protein [Anaerolineae bacterium]